MVAGRLGALFFDTGVLYRAVAHRVLQLRIDPENDSAVERIAASLDVELVDSGQGTRVLLAGTDITDQLRRPAIDRALPPIAANPGVRLRLVGIQREIAGRSDSVVVGRDIGSVILPDAALKFYIDAAQDVRAGRRYRELIERGTGITRDQVLDDLRKRDHRDRTRDDAPLTKAADAVEIDATSATVDEIVDCIVDRAEKAGLLCRA